MKEVNKKLATARFLPSFLLFKEEGRKNGQRHRDESRKEESGLHYKRNKKYAPAINNGMTGRKISGRSCSQNPPKAEIRTGTRAAFSGNKSNLRSLFLPPVGVPAFSGIGTAAYPFLRSVPMRHPSKKAAPQNLQGGLAVF